MGKSSCLRYMKRSSGDGLTCLESNECVAIVEPKTQSSRGSVHPAGHCQALTHPLSNVFRCGDPLDQIAHVHEEGGALRDCRLGEGRHDERGLKRKSQLWNATEEC